MKFIFIKYFPSYETRKLQSSVLAPYAFYTHQALEVWQSH